ncbi:MAG TPA: M1 family aminopeptidase, partial [Blastocatellia bacterium]|nr:M1 family aminopeptidase [Blastocatellia bacterium]
RSLSVFSACLFLTVLWGAEMASIFRVDRNAQAQSANLDYKIELDLDYRAATFKGREIVTVNNSTRHYLDNISFFLYPNIGQTEEASYLTVNSVVIAGRDARFELKANNSVLQVDLPSKLEPDDRIEIALEFTGRVPRLQREETTLLAHFLHEANDAVSSERQRQDARDIFFAAEQSMLLGYFFPMVAPPDAVAADRGLAFGVGGIVYSEPADFEVSVNADSYLTIIGSAPAVEETPVSIPDKTESTRRQQVFRGSKLRGFALALAENLRVQQKQAGTVRLRSYFEAGNEKLGQRVLDITAKALSVYSNAFGQYSFPSLSIIELPLPAGYSGIEFPGFIVLAQAYCIDFESPQSTRLPNLVREQADVITSALDFTLAHCLAHQWWGSTVGSDPQRSPYLDESLANFAAAYFYEATYGKEAGEDAINKHLRATYQTYRSLGGVDTEMDKSARDFRSAMQYAAIVQAKGAMMMIALRKQLGDEAFFKAIKGYYEEFSFKFATPRDWREALLSASKNPAATKTLINRYTKEKRGDQDIGTPNIMLLTAGESKGKRIGRIAAKSSKAGKLGGFFSRIGRAAAKPF